MPNKVWYKRWWGILILVISMFSLALGFAFSLAIISTIRNGSNPTSTTPSSKNISQDKLKLIEGDNSNYWFGSNKPKITIVEFADFACPYCRKSFSKIREISKKYNDIKIIFRDLPIISEHSVSLAMAARCAGEQGLFWVMHDKLFINQGVSTDQDMYRLAKEIGANESRFKSCYDSKKYFDNIEKDYNDALALGITSGTPVWFINNQMITGDIPYELFIEIIEKMLSEPKKPLGLSTKANVEIP